jgi:hypothetical protein
MALRHNHYEAAFEAYLRQRRTPYVAVDEKRRSLLAEASLKSMDFIVHAPGGDNLLVDVKGRRYPTAGNGGRWENWVTSDDVDSLLKWEEVFGAGYRAVFLFAYDVDPGHESDFEDLFEFREKRYAYFGISACDYKAVMTTRSPRWDTFSVARRPFAELRSPVEAFLTPVTPPAAP